MVNRSAAAAVGIFLLVASVYVLASPGRIDIIDGQYRFEVARNLLDIGSPQIRDRYLGGGATRGRGGRYYVGYGLAGSVVSLPLVGAGRAGDASGAASIDRQQFFFSLTSPALGAATAALLFVFYLTLGVSRRSAFLWTMVAAFATLAFPAATSVFDQVQHSFFVLAACFFAFLGARRDSVPLAAAGGLALAVLVNFQEAYAIFFPTLGLATFAAARPAAGQQRRALIRYVVFMGVGGLGLLAWAGINYVRFEHVLFSGKGVNHPAVLGDPLVGLTALLFSPGKSIFLYSPPVLLALFGVRELFRRERRLALATLTASLAHLALVSSLSFFAGDWCWGPRYFVPILPLLALGLPMFQVRARSDRVLLPVLVAAGLAVQVMAISVDHHRFFYERGLPAFFWDGNPQFYFRESALLNRPGEILEAIRHGVPPEADAFRPGPYPDLLTYAVFGGWTAGEPMEFTGPTAFFWPAREWMRRFQVFWLPRPWPLWMSNVPRGERPINVEIGTGILLAVALTGALAVRHALVH
ncbi:MAG: hypothetical protein HYU53_06275 [Acidobacteria bacterium]|nr:hypothetical protein [Acidobacteriota bacterium]